MVKIRIPISMDDYSDSIVISFASMLSKVLNGLKSKDRFSLLFFHYAAIFTWIYLALRSSLKKYIPIIDPEEELKNPLQRFLSNPIILFLIIII